VRCRRTLEDARNSIRTLSQACLPATDANESRKSAPACVRSHYGLQSCGTRSLADRGHRRVRPGATELGESSRVAIRAAVEGRGTSSIPPAGSWTRASHHATDSTLSRSMKGRERPRARIPRKVFRKKSPCSPEEARRTAKAPQAVESTTSGGIHHKRWNHWYEPIRTQEQLTNCSTSSAAPQPPGFGCCNRAPANKDCESRPLCRLCPSRLPSSGDARTSLKQPSSPTTTQGRPRRRFSRPAPPTAGAPD
jgi:hypothetical protein